MKVLLLFLFLYPLIRAEDCWPATWTAGFWDKSFFYVGDNKHCNITRTPYTTGDGLPLHTALLSLEMKDIGINESVRISWGNNSISNNGKPTFSIQQFIPHGSVTIFLDTGSSSRMAGNYYYTMTYDLTEIPVMQVNVSYGQEGFSLNPYILNSRSQPRKFEITADSKVALINVAFDICADNSCTDLIWIYEGMAENAQYIGTAADIYRKLYISQGKTVTLYWMSTTSSAADRSWASLLDVIANEAKNLEKCSVFDVITQPLQEDSIPVFNYSIDATGGGGACLTCWGSCYVQDATQFGNSVFYAYAGVPHPDPIQAGFVLDNYSNRNASYAFPQYFPGTYVTYYVADGAVTLVFNNESHYFVPKYGRNGFIQSYYYPLSLPADDDYITDNNLSLSEVEKTYEPAGSNASIEIRKKKAFFQKIPFDVKTNVGVPTTFQVAPYTYFEVILHDGSIPNQGSLISWNIGNVPTGNNPTTKKPDSPKIVGGKSFIMITVIALFILLL